MTAQMCDFFEYAGNEYCLVGYTGGKLPSADDFGMRFYPGSTADARGHCMTYGIDEANMLVVKRIQIRGEEIAPISHPYKTTIIDHGTYYDNLNRIIPLTGHILFSDVWQFRDLYVETLAEGQDRKYALFEAQVDQGRVVKVTEIGDETRRKALGHDRHETLALWQGKTDAEKLANVERVWDITATILPRKYDALYMTIWYFNFREYIDELQNKLS